MQLLRFGYLGKRFSGGFGNIKHWILSTTYWNDSSKWIDTEIWLDGLEVKALYYGVNIFTYDGNVIKYE